MSAIVENCGLDSDWDWDCGPVPILVLVPNIDACCSDTGAKCKGTDDDMSEPFSWREDSSDFGFVLRRNLRRLFRLGELTSFGEESFCGAFSFSMDWDWGKCGCGCGCTCSSFFFPFRILAMLCIILCGVPVGRCVRMYIS